MSDLRGVESTSRIDVETCPRCGGRMRLVALITEPKNVDRFRHLGEPTHRERSAQMGLFEEH